MSFALVATMLSSLFAALMIIFDRLMVTDCYDKKPSLAWFVSLSVGSVLGLIVTGLVWIGVYIANGINILDLAQTTWYPYGLWMLLAGVFTSQYLRHYFRIFIPEHDGAELNETGVAMWIASIPIFFLITVIVINKLGLNIGLFQHLENATMSWTFVSGVVIATFGLIGFERISGGNEGGSKKVYAKEISLMMFFTILYTLIIFSVMMSIEDTFGSVGVLALSVLPFYWVGFSSGTLIFLKSSFRAEVKGNMLKMRYFVVPILIAEIFGMLLFLFEYLGLSEIDPTLVSLIISTSVLLVYFMNYILKGIRLRLESRNLHEWTLFGYNISRDALPRIVSRNVALEITFIALTLIGLNICLQLVM